jgi:hydroxyacylglutathione hydrolase
MKLNIRVIESEQFGQNAYLAWKDGSSDAIIVDPGFDTSGIFDHLQREKLNLVAILNTHGHVDHIAGNADVKKAYPAAPIIIGTGDAEMLTNPKLNLSAKWGFHIVSPAADQFVNEGDVLNFGFDLAVLEIPGHSPGHVVKLENSTIVFGGDVLFRDSIGRTDFPNGNFAQLAHGIRTKLYTLPDNTRVLPGHGPTTTTGQEKKMNPFVPYEPEA